MGVREGGRRPRACIVASFASSIDTIGAMQPSSTSRATIAAARAPGSDWYECIALATTQPASFLTSNSSLAKRSITSAGSGVFISRSSCAGVPAATLDIAQHASFRVCILALCSTAGSISRMPWSRTCCVASSDPDIIEEIARMPGRRTASGIGWGRRCWELDPCCTYEPNAGFRKMCRLDLPDTYAFGSKSGTNLGESMCACIKVAPSLNFEELKLGVLCTEADGFHVKRRDGGRQ